VVGVVSLNTLLLPPEYVNQSESSLEIVEDILLSLIILVDKGGMALIKNKKYRGG
jgi:hypothetical protein